MSNYIEVIAIVEGKTEQVFIENILADYLGKKYIGIKATQASKSGQKGGDIKFSRVIKDLGFHLKQRPNTYVTTLIDYYGTKEWPGLDKVSSNSTPSQIAKVINTATKIEVNNYFSEQQSDRRFIPYISIHEFEALLFSDSKILSERLGINESIIFDIISEFGLPEAINDSPDTAPSKRLAQLSRNRSFSKTIDGIAIAKAIGIEKIRERCNLFDLWIKKLEEIQRNC